MLLSVEIYPEGNIMSKKPETKVIENVKCFDHMPMNLRPQPKTDQPVSQPQKTTEGKKP